jgi:trigger factor
MPKVVREDLDQFNSVLTVSINKSDYESEFNKSLNKYKDQAQMKGFRKGKTPMGMVKKMVGKSLLAETVTQLLQKELDKYLQEEKPDIIGYPLHTENQAEIDFNPDQLTDFNFKFDMGIIPPFEIAGIGEKDTYNFFEVEVTSEMVDKEFKEVLKSIASREDSEGPALEGDMIYLKAVNSEDNSIANEFSVVLNDTVTDDFKKKVIGKNVGFNFDFNIFKIEITATRKIVTQYFIGLKDQDDFEGNENFNLTISKISKTILPEVNQETLDQLFGKDVVDSEESAKEKIKGFIENHRKNEATVLFFNEIYEELLKKNDFPLPDEFVKRFLPISDEKITAEDVEENYDKYAKSIRWTLVKEKLIKQFDLKVQENEIISSIRSKIRNMLGGSPYMGADFLDDLTRRLLQDKAQVQEAFDQVMTDKLAVSLRDHVKLKKKKLSDKEFQEVIQKESEKRSKL